MFALVVLVPLVWLVGIVAVAVLGLGGFLVVGFFVGWVAGTTALAVGIGLLALAFLGRFLILGFKRGDANEPREDRTGIVERLRRPDGAELQVETYGPHGATPIVLTHGWGSDSTQWYYLKQSLSDRFRVVVWDVRGLGRSSRSADGEYSLDRMADDLAAIVEHVDDPRTVVVGHSMGGMLILRLARRVSALEKRIGGIVLANTTHINPVRTTAAGRLLTALERPLVVPLLHLTKWLFPVVWLMNWVAYLNGSMHLMLALTGFAGTESRGQLDRVALLGARQHPGVLARQGLAMRELNEVETLFAVRVPVLLLTADRDRITVPQASEEIRRKVEDAELVMLEPSGHVSVFERHSEFAAAVASFAQSRDTSGRERVAAAG